MIAKEDVLNFMREAAYKPLTVAELVDEFGVADGEIAKFVKLLNSMEAEGEIVKTRFHRYGVPERMNLVVGYLDGNPKGFGFVVADNPEVPDLFISPENMNGAMHHDRVIARIYGRTRGLKREGEVIRILKRVNQRLVGTFERSGHYGFVVPADRKIWQDIFIPKNATKNAKDGQIVEVEITRWPEARRNPEGKIREVIGFKGEPGNDIKLIIKEYKLPEEFPAKVLKEAEKIPLTIEEAEIARRRDLREMMIFTIDGEDAKDLDDAVSLEKMANGHYRLGVHIADVSFYVRENSALDREALARGTSVYLVDRVIPMLPPRLSNGICSLNPHEDRLTLSVLMEIDNKGEVIQYEIFESVIRSKARLTYKKVAQALEDVDRDVRHEYADVLPTLEIMKELAEILTERRRRRGSIDFDLPETKVILNELGGVLGIELYERNIATRIIEEFMLVTNETVAQHAFFQGIPFIYRNHEKPDDDRINEFNEFLHGLGYHLKGVQDIHPQVLQELLQMVEGKPEEKVINTVMLRSMKQARYEAENKGHFGLAAEYYAHFTSPIRRYPDLMIHRILREVLTNKYLKPKRIAKLDKVLPDIARQSSERERLAQEAERETVDLKKVQYMLDKVGEVYRGLISGVTNSGMFVELDNTVEGFIHISTMLDDYYHHDEKTYSLIGERSKKTYRIGDQVEVRVIKVNPDLRQIDFELTTP